MANHMKHMINHMNAPVQHSQKVGDPRKASGSLKERAAALGSPLLSVLANLHHLMGTLMQVMLLMGGTGMMSGMQIPSWIRRGLLVMALLAAGFTVYHMLSRKQTRWVLLFSSGSVLFTAGMIIWSIATFGF
jgi:membrane-bound ClpP family serine protease